MSQQISDLIINLDVDSASFAEQIPRIKKMLTGMADTSDESSQRMTRFAERQKKAMQQLESAGGQAAVAIQEKHSSATTAMQSDWEKTSQAVQEAHDRVEALSQQLAKSQATERQQDEMTASFFQQIDAVKRLSGETQSLTTIQAQLRQARAQGNISQQDYLALLTRSTERQRELRIEEEKATASRVQFIQNLKSQVATQNLSRAELLRYQAAQLGVSNAADVYINKLDAAKKTTHGLGIESKAARQEMGILISEVLRGNFGALQGSSITLANRAGWIDQLLTLRGLGIAGVVGGIAASVYGLSKAWHQGNQESVEFNKQLILTGNYVGKTAGQLQDMARVLSGNGITQSNYAEALAKIVGSGSFSGGQISLIAKASAEMEKATGQSVDETIKQFKSLQDDPVKAITTLNDSLHFLTAKQYEQIASAQSMGDSERAAALATQAYSDAVIERAKAVKENLGSLESAWEWVKNEANRAWDAMLGVGRNPSAALKRQESFKEWQDAEKNLKTLSDNLKVDPNYSGSNPLMKADADRLKRAREEVALKKQSYDLADKEYAAEGLKAERERLARQEQDNAINNQREFNQLVESGLLPAEKRARAEKELNKLILKNKQDAQAGIATLWSERDIANARAGIEKKYKDPKTPKTKGYVTPAGDRAEDNAQRDLLALQSQLEVLQKHKGINDTISKQRQDLWTAEAQFSVLEEASRSRQLSQQEKSLLSSKEQVLQLARQKALLGDQIVAQEQLNKRMDTAQKYATQMAEKQTALKASSTMSDRMAGRESVYAQLRSGWQNSGGSLEDSGYQKQLDAAKNYFAEEDKLRGDWKAGAQKSWADYSDAATNTYEQMKNAGTGALNGISSYLTSVLTTGKASFKDFTKSILSMLTEILIKMQLVNGVNSAMSAFGWGGVKANANGGVYNSASLSAFSGSIVDKPTFFAFANGGGVMGEAGPEAILPLKRGANGKLGVVAGNAGGVSPVFNNTIILQSDATATSKTSGGNDAMNQAVMKMLDKFCQEKLINALRPGGLLFNVINTR